MTDVTPTITATTGPNGIRIVDPIESVQFTLLTPGPADPDPATQDAFPMPIDTAAVLAYTRLETPYLVNLMIRDADMNLVTQYTSGESASLPPDEYYVEVPSAKMKLYLRVEGGIEIAPRAEQTRLVVTGADAVTVGVRSFHERPAATIQTTTAPDDVAAALSHLGSALKTTSCERSFPTLRGHPPLFEPGPELSIPDVVDAPETGVRVVVPPRLDALFPVTPLAYYFGATVETGGDPVLVADGERFPLDDDGFEATVARVLRQAFLLDCVTRTEGLYEVDLQERRQVESRVDLDFAALYDEPLTAQLRSYLQIPFESVADAVPTWKLTADVVPDPDHVPALPFLARELALVRCPDEADLRARSLDDATPEVRSFFRSEERVVRESGTSTRGSRRRSNDATAGGELVFEPPAADSIEQTYVGTGIPLGASKITVEQLYRRLDVEPASDERIRVLVICNDEGMREENAVGDVYGTREWVEFDITTREALTTDEFAAALREDIDFLHYIGHVDDQGIRCVDGHLDARTLESVGVSAFLLNACQSYEQGRALVEAGALGGVVTLTEILDRTATEIGGTVARFLNQGFSLLSMFDLLKQRNRLAQRYMVVGDGNVTLVESESGTPYSASVERTSDEEFTVELFGYPSKNYNLGTLFMPYITDGKTCYLNSGVVDRFSVSPRQLSEFLDMQAFPVEVDKELYWSDELSVSELG